MMVFTSSSEAAELVIRPTEQLPQVVVRENFIQLATTKLESVLRENGEVRRHKIEAVNVPAGARLPAGRIDYETFIPNGIRYGNRTQVWININVNGEKVVTNTPIPDHQAAVDMLLESLVIQA